MVGFDVALWVFLTTVTSLVVAGNTAEFVVQQHISTDQCLPEEEGE